MNFLDLRHDGGASLQFYNPLIFMEMDFTHYCQQPGSARSLDAAETAGD